MKHFWIVVAVALSAGGVSGLLILGLMPRAHAAKTPEPRHDEPSSTSGDNAPTIIERQVIVHESSPVPSTQAPSTTPAEPEAVAAANSDPVDLAAEMESMFQNDRASGEEGRKFESLVREGFRDPGMTGAKVDRIDCKAVTCRVEVTFDNREADNNALHALVSSQAGIMNHGRSLTIPVRNVLPDGRIAATIYFYPSLPPVPRPGATPPS